MKTYLSELRGQVRGNARLRRRLDANAAEIARLRGHIRSLVTMLDRLGHGDDVVVVRAAAAAGWERYTAEMRAEILREIEKVCGVRL